MLRSLLLALVLLLPLGMMPAAAEIRCDDLPESTTVATPAATPVADAAAFPKEGTVTVLAAASLVDAFAEMEAAIEDAHDGVDVVIETAGSQTLVTQLRQGAPADVLATADEITMGTAADEGLLAGEPVLFARNTLVLVVPEDNPAAVASLADLAREGVVVVLPQGEVPAGRYTRAALCAWAETDAPEGFLDGVNANLASEEPDVRAVLAKVQLGEADAGITYATDAAHADVEVIPLPEGLPVDAAYPIAPVSGGDEAMAAAFIAFVRSDAGLAILQEHGFPAGSAP